MFLVSSREVRVQDREEWVKDVFSSILPVFLHPSGKGSEKEKKRILGG
jgi:hypothetical protein